MLKAGKTGSFSCETTVALSRRRASRFWHRGKRAWQWRCEQKWLLVTVQSSLASMASQPPSLPPPHARLILFIWRGLSKCEIVRISEATNCFLSVWKFHCSPQDLETPTLLRFKKKFFFCRSCTFLPPHPGALREPSGAARCCYNANANREQQKSCNRMRIRRGLVHQCSKDSKGLYGICLKICSQLAQYFFS